MSWRAFYNGAIQRLFYCTRYNTIAISKGLNMQLFVLRAPELFSLLAALLARLLMFVVVEFLFLLF